MNSLETSDDDSSSSSSFVPPGYVQTEQGDVFPQEFMEWVGHQPTSHGHMIDRYWQWLDETTQLPLIEATLKLQRAQHVNPNPLGLPGISWQRLGANKGRLKISAGNEQEYMNLHGSSFLDLLASVRAAVGLLDSLRLSPGQSALQARRA